MAKKIAAKEPVAAPRQKPSALVDSHYVKAMLDQILEGVIETAKYVEYAKCFL